MRTFPIAHFSGEAAAVEYSAETQAYFNTILSEAGIDAPTTYPAWAAAVNTLISSLVSQGIWAKADAVYIPLSPANLAARIDAKRLVVEASVVSPFVAYQGWVGNGGTGAVDTNYDPSTDGVNWQQDSACIYGYSREVISSNAYATYGGGSSLLVFARDVGTSNHYASFAMNSSSTDSAAVATVPRGWSVNRSSGMEVQLYLNGDLHTSVSGSASEPVAPGSLLLMSEDPGAPMAPYGLSFWLAGGSLDAGEQYTLHTLVGDFVSSMYSYTTFQWIGADLPQLWNAAGITGGQTDPNDSTGAYLVDLSAGMAPTSPINVHQPGDYVLYVFLRGDVAGSVDVFDDNAGTFSTAVEFTDTWSIYVIPFTAAAEATNILPVFGNLATATEFYVWNPGIESA